MGHLLAAVERWLQKPRYLFQRYTTIKSFAVVCLTFTKIICSFKMKLFTTLRELEFLKIIEANVFHD